MDAKKLSVLDITEYNLIANKNPQGSYDRQTRENLLAIIDKLRKNPHRLSLLEQKLYQKFQFARFSALGEKDKRVKLEVARYQLSSRAQHILRVTASSVALVCLLVLFTYHVLLNESGQRRVDRAFYAGLHQMGLVSEDELQKIQEDLTLTERSLQLTQQEKQELAQTLDQMIRNNQVVKNLKYIVKRIHNDPRTRYVNTGQTVDLYFDNRRIGRYFQDPKLWYLLGVIDSGSIRIYYKNEELLEIDSIFGRKGEETPLGEYEIQNKIPKPTWYKKEVIDGRTRVRAIPFGDPDHEIGYWWMGLRKLGPEVPGSYGIHGVNSSKFNEFIKKKFDWRSGSAGCPNIQAWNLEFLAKVVPEGTRVNIVQSAGGRQTGSDKSA